MMTFFRRFASSPIGIGIFAVILIAFVVTLYQNKSITGRSGFSGGGGAIASVGGEAIADSEALRRTTTQFEAARVEKPELDMATFVAQGGADRTIEQMITGRALEIFAGKHGLTASRKLVDGAIASIAAFNGPDGKFDRTTYLGILQQRKIVESQLREDFAREAVTKMLLVPVAGGAKVPVGLVAPYASLMLETRQGLIASVPSAAFATTAPPSDSDLTDFYKRNIGHYTVPERRVINIARFDRARFEGKVAPSEAEIAAAYKAGAAKYAGRETRGFTQIIVPKQADATALLAKVKGGTAMADAAKSLGLEALAVPATDKTAFEKLTGPRVAQAAFAAPKGGFAALAQSGLGFHIVRVDSVATIAGQSLDQARGDIVTELSKVKIDEALGDFVAKIEDDINGGATFDDVVKKYALTASATPAITAGGLAPDGAGFTLPPEYVPLLRDAFQADSGDDPQVASIGNGTAYALYHMDRVIPSAPRALTQIRTQVTADALLTRAADAAKAVADAVAASINRGTPFAQAIASAGVKLPAAQPAGGRRLDLAQSANKVPPPLAMMFAMAQKRARVLAMPQRGGWFVVYLDKIVAGDARLDPSMVTATQAQLARVIGDEYVAQFAGAVSKQVGVTRNGAAVDAFKKSLTGGAAR